MKDPEARRRLKEMLEFQMNEKIQANGRTPGSKNRGAMRQGGRPPMTRGGTLN